MWNGPVGAFEIEPFGEGTYELMREVARLVQQSSLTSDRRRRRHRGGAQCGWLRLGTSAMSPLPAAPFLNGSEGKTLPAVAALAEANRGLVKR